MSMTAPLSRPTKRYTAFGLDIASEIPLAELEFDGGSDGAGQREPDLTIRLLPARVPELPEGRQVWFEHGEREHVLAWSAVGRFRIVGQNLIEVEPAPGVESGLIALPLLGPVMALLLQVRGLLVLHASAVDIGPGAVVFAGDKTAGKSTTASAFVAAGHRLLTDDIVAIDLSGPEPLLRPGFPQLKLEASSAAPSLAVLGDVLPPPVPGFPKRQHRLAQGFSTTPVKPLRFYVLQRGTEAALTALSPQDALMCLLRFSYTVRFRREALGQEGGARHFRQCAAMAGSTPVKRLQVPTGVDRLPEAVAIVVEDCS